MNIHPLLVHFPIAIFLLYAGIEILCLDKKFPSLKTTKQFLAIFSFFAAYATFASGDTAKHLLGKNIEANLRTIVNMHENLAGLFTFISGAIALITVIGWVIEKYPMFTVTYPKLSHNLSFFTKRWLLIALAIVGVGLISVVGGLGGIIVYGPNIDPMTKWLYSVVIK